MKEKLAISGYCSIRDEKLIVDGKAIAHNPGKSIGDFMSEIYRNFSVCYPKFHKMDNLGKLGFLVAEMILRDRNINTRYSGDEVGIIMMNSASSLDTDRIHQDTIASRSEYFPSPSVFVYTLPNVVIGEICIRHKFFGEGNFFVAEKFNPGFIADYITYLFDNKIVGCCLAGWIELDGDKSEAILFLIEKSSKTESGIANFDASAIMKIYNSK